MKIDEALLERLAHLARLDIPAEARPAVQRDLQQMLNFVERLQEISVEGASPMISPIEHSFAGTPDEPAEAMDREAMLSQAPDRQGPYFRLPKVVNKEG